MSVVEDVFFICRLWVIVLYVTCVFLVSCSEGTASLTYIRMFVSLVNLSEIFLNLRRIQRDITINIHKSSYKVSVISVIF